MTKKIDTFKKQYASEFIKPEEKEENEDKK